MSKKARLFPLHSTQRGAAAIEFAFILPLLLLIFTGMVEYGRAMWHYDALAKAARDAARYLSTVPTASLGSEATSATSISRTIVSNAASTAGVTVSGLAPLVYIVITCGDSAGATTSCAGAATGTVNTVNVDINYPFVIGGWIPVFGPSPSDAPSVITAALAPHVTMRYMR